MISHTHPWHNCSGSLVHLPLKWQLNPIAIEVKARTNDCIPQRAVRLITYWCLFCTNPWNVYLLYSCFLAHQHSRRLLQTRRLPWLPCCRCPQNGTWSGCIVLASWSLMPVRHRNCNITRSMHNDWPPAVNVYCVTFHLHLTHQDLKRMAEILHTQHFQMYFLWKKVEFQIIFDWNTHMFIRV